jgi:HAD superfamily hydrolase (TIGR01509 family)
MVNDGAVSLRPGVLHLIDAASQAGLHLAIATTTSPVNIAALLRGAIGPDWRQFFGIVEDASTAAIKKPHPQVYLQTLHRLQLPAADCLAFEDSANGLRAARGAGLATVITPTGFTADHDFSGALKVLPNLQGVTVADLHAWHAKPTA